MHPRANGLKTERLNKVEWRVPILEFNNFSCERDGEPLFHPLTFALNKGDVVQIVGPNGAGKTTFLRSLCGLFGGWQGQMQWCGESIQSPNFEMKSQILYMGHQPGVKKSLTARENLLWYFGMQGYPFPGQVEEALAQVGLSGYEDVPCFQMSAGQHRRVALARLYVTSATVWVLDEPFTAIDRLGVKNLETLVESHASNGGIVVLTTHQPLSLSSVQMIELVPYAVLSQ
jgi:heme exporter protein A